MAENGWVLIDDRDPGIAYYGPPGATLWHGGVSQEYMETTTGLDLGDTATYYFNALSIGVFGTYGPTGGSGPPIAAYQVDNTPATTVTAPITQATMYRQNLWTSDPQLPSLAPGAFHKLVVTATAPNNTLWIDYLAYPLNSAATTTSTSSASTSSSTFSTSATPTPSSVTTSTTNAGKQTASPAGTSNTNTNVGDSTTSSTITSTTNAGNQTASPAGTSNTSTNVGAIVAGIIVGTVAFILATAAFVVYMRRRRPRPTAREYLIPGEIDTSSDMSQNHTTLSTPTATPLPLQSEDAPSYSSIPQQEGSRDEFPRPLPQVPTRTFDGGVRLMGGPQEIPPEYQEHY